MTGTAPDGAEHVQDLRGTPPLRHPRRRPHGAHIRQSMAHIRQSMAHIRQSMAHIRQSRAYVRQSLAHIRQSMAHIRQSRPATLVLYKICGKLLPCVIHVAARKVPLPHIRQSRPDIRQSIYVRQSRRHIRQSRTHIRQSDLWGTPPLRHPRHRPHGKGNNLALTVLYVP